MENITTIASHAQKTLIKVKENLDNVDHLITIISIIYFLIMVLQKYIENQKIKKNFLSSIEKNVIQLEKSSDKLLDSYILIIGSFAFYQHYEPLKSSEKSDKLVNDFYKNYQKTIKDIRKLIETLNIYESDLDKILGREDKFSLKHIKQAFIGKEPDFEIIYKDVKIRKILTNQITTPKKFNEMFNNKLQKMVKNMNIRLSYLNSIKKVVTNKNFQKDVNDTILKYVKG